MFALRVFDVVLLVHFLQFVFECLFSVLLSRQHSVLLQKCFHKIVALNLFQIKISFQAMIQLLLCRKKLVRYLDNRIVVSKTVRVFIKSQLLRNVAF